MDQREFINIIRSYRRRLNLAEFLKRLMFALSIGAGVGIVFQLLSFVMPLYYVNLYTVIALILAVAAAVFVSLVRRSTMKQAALVMDSFGFKERIITAYEHMRENGVLPALQRNDAMEQLRRHSDRIKIPLWPGLKKTALPVVLLAVMIGISFIPSRMKEQAKELHQIHNEAKEKEEEIEEVLDKLEELAELEKDTLTPEQIAKMQEMMESLQASMNEYRQADSAEALNAAGDKLNYKYEDMSSKMADMARSMQAGATVSPMSAESMQAMADKLKEMSGNPSSGGDSLASNQGQDEQDGQGNDQSGQSNGQNGQGNDQNGQGNGQNGQNGQGSDQGGQNGQNGQDGQGGSQNGNGNGQGEQGSGQNGQGDSHGNGRGTGSVNYEHDYVSIPNDIADSENLTGNSVDHNNSEYFRAQNGLSWEGTHIPYDEVIESYEKNAYEGIAAGKYPSGMENIIKEYFSSF
ncbi:MAG: hypothetical protein J1E98_10235 [Lachnospiraceae bacterium]|nr:hypothetical protein [Lachnospiraceae bacterium]